ncbi:MAG: RNA polymerase sigma factor [Limisphaerales bacterium]
MDPPNGNEQDALDMARLADGQDPALNDLMDRHGPTLFHYLVRSLQNQDDAADLAQETFARVYENRDKFDPRRKFSTWLYAIATNLVRDRFRWRARHPQVSLDAENPQTDVSLRDTLRAADIEPDQALEVRERSAAVRQAVAALPSDLRQPLVLALYEGRSQADIGQILDCSAKAVETRLYRARQKLRESLRKFLP